MPISHVFEAKLHFGQDSVTTKAYYVLPHINHMHDLCNVTTVGTSKESILNAKQLNMTSRGKS